MQKAISLALTASIFAVMLAGCTPDTSGKPASAEEKKAFVGGPMPPEARKQFEEAQKQSAKVIADNAAKARANAIATH